MTATCRAMLASRRGRILTIVLLLAAIWTILSPSLTSAFAGIGGLVSEKLLGDGTNENQYLGDGTNQLVVLGLGPAVSTLPVASSTSIGGTISATLRGNLQDLRGLPRADVWFVWGYSPSSLTNTTSAKTVFSAGEQTAVINPKAGVKVYYQFRAKTDGTSSGGVLSFVAGGGHGASYWFMKTVLPIVVGGAILVFVLLATGNPLLALLGGVIGIVAFYIVQSMAGLF